MSHTSSLHVEPLYATEDPGTLLLGGAARPLRVVHEEHVDGRGQIMYRRGTTRSPRVPGVDGNVACFGILYCTDK